MLDTRIIETIRRDGPIGFAGFMDLALYDPEHGYYADPDLRIGRTGDFFTSVSVGPAFGAILAHWALDCWNALGRPGRWRIAEPGAHDATLARDIATTLARLDPAAARSLVYTIPEPLPARRTALAETLASTELPGGVTPEIIAPAATPPAKEGKAHAQREAPLQKSTINNQQSKINPPPPLPGIVIANEVLDALPCHLLEFDGSRWLERAVDLAPAPSDHFVFRTREIADPVLAAQAECLGDRFPAGYQTELRTNFAAFLAPLRDLLSRGRLLFLDYGFARPELYDPARREGTLRTFRAHRADDNPLANPGRLDITAHVDFTAVARIALSLGMEPARFAPQGNFLTEAGRPWIESIADLPEKSRARAVRQFQTLVHPAHLGMRFHALELAWRTTPDPDIAAQALRRLAMEVI